MGDHVERFNPNGRYKQIPLSYWAIIDFCHYSLRPDPKTLEPMSGVFYTKMTTTTAK